MLSTPFDVTRIAVTNPAVADAVVVQPREVLIDGKSAGTVSLIVWGGDRRRQYDVVVDPGVTPLQQTFQKLFPGEDIRVAMNDESIILYGQRVEQCRHAARGRDRRRRCRARPTSSTCCSCPAARRASRSCCRSGSPRSIAAPIKELGINLFADAS